MQKYLLAIVLMMCGSVQASSPDLRDYLKDVDCAGKVREKLGAHLLKQTWYPATSAEPAKRMKPAVAFRDTRTEKAYKIWSEGKQINLSEKNLATMKETLNTWDSTKACEAKTTEQVFTYPSLPTEAGFKDSDLKATMEAHPWGVIYLWTPYMPLSVDAIKEIKKAVQDKGGHLTILLDPKAKVKDAEPLVAKGDVQKSELTQVASHELYAREIGLHYPTALIYKNKFLSNRDYAGHKKSDVYKKWIDKELADLEKDMK